MASGIRAYDGWFYDVRLAIRAVRGKFSVGGFGVTGGGGRGLVRGESEGEERAILRNDDGHRVSLLRYKVNCYGLGQIE